MKVIGITGGIGSGKSLVARLLQEYHGAYIVNTDCIAREQMEIGGVSYQPIVDFFGNEILCMDSTINRTKLAEIVFKDKEKLLKINEITHPLVLEEVKEVIRTLKEAGEVPYLVIETALMIESGYDVTCDEVWYVFAPEEERRRRLKEERNYSDQKIDSIFESQSKEEAFRRKFHKIIENTGDIEDIKKQVAILLMN
ncbi:MAG: hypothetical protein K0S76_1284 [Herbinix sp.]|jgi:dephospho-CoA kinase|nr:hypothetical protein [Herbinix sp.]